MTKKTTDGTPKTAEVRSRSDEEMRHFPVVSATMGIDEPSLSNPIKTNLAHSTTQIGGESDISGPHGSPRVRTKPENDDVQRTQTLHALNAFMAVANGENGGPGLDPHSVRAASAFLAFMAGQAERMNEIGPTEIWNKAIAQFREWF